MGNDKKNKVTVEIYGQKYRLVGEVTPTYIKEVAKHVDAKMSQLAGKNANLDPTKVAVLTALNLAEDYFSLQREYDELFKFIEQDTDKN